MLKIYKYFIDSEKLHFFIYFCTANVENNNMIFFMILFITLVVSLFNE